MSEVEIEEKYFLCWHTVPNHVADAMDNVSVCGIEMIQSLQKRFEGYSDEMMFASHLGDPRNAFLIYFPLAYFLSAKLGVTVMWIAALSEWLNAVFKWLLFGHRPYWWVHTTDVYNDDPRPVLQQFHLTCETGPGSPSGHAMITSAVLFPIFMAISAQTQRKFFRLILWLTFGVFMLAVCVSRLFIATHFPHQVVAGVFFGSLFGRFIGSLPLSSSHLKSYMFWGLVILVSSPSIVWILHYIGYDASWSVFLAKKYCAKPEWVYLDTTPMYSIIRDAGQLIGMGIALSITKTDISLSSLPAKFIALTLALFFTRSMEYVVLPSEPCELFYILAFAKNAVIPIVVVLFIPGVLGTCFTAPKEKPE